MEALRDKLKLTADRMDEINNFIMDPNNKLVNDLLDLIDKYGGIEEIKRKAKENGKLENLMARLEEKKPEYAEDIRWLIRMRDEGAFITETEYRRKVLGDKADTVPGRSPNPNRNRYAREASMCVQGGRKSVFCGRSVFLPMAILLPCPVDQSGEARTRSPSSVKRSSWLFAFTPFR